MISIRKLLISLTFVFLIILMLSSQISCTGGQPKQIPPKMTASEVCQYVNQALPIDYSAIPNMPASLRYEIRFTAINASYDTSNSRWLVNVNVVNTPQVLANNVWADTSARGLTPISSTQQYYFYETTGAVVKK
jgi:hypothetical protein